MKDGKRTIILYNIQVYSIESIINPHLYYAFTVARDVLEIVPETQDAVMQSEFDLRMTRDDRIFLAGGTTRSLSVNSSSSSESSPERDMTSLESGVGK